MLPAAIDMRGLDPDQSQTRNEVSNRAVLATGHAMSASGASELERPIDRFSTCHADIRAHLQAFGELPRLLEQAQRARNVAELALRLFDQTLMEHHADEESALFPAVKRSARPGEESDRVAAIIERLIEEHRQIERSWK